MCSLCERGSWDRVVLEGHPRLRQHLAAKGVKIGLNARGWLDIPPR
jgi:hypothetical protein